MTARRRESTPRSPDSSSAARRPLGLRIIGGTMRGRKLEYSGDSRTRPMKDRLREAVFNLIGPAVVGSVAIDLFAGTGALGFEALSRGAGRAVFIERHLPTAALIRRNAANLGLDLSRYEVVGGSAFLWQPGAQLPAGTPWIVFCSPPWEFFHTRTDEMLQLIGRLVDSCPPGSVIVVEADDRFDLALLPQKERWDIRPYPPAVIALLRIPRD